MQVIFWNSHCCDFRTLATVSTGNITKWSGDSKDIDYSKPALCITEGE